MSLVAVAAAYRAHGIKHTVVAAKSMKAATELETVMDWVTEHFQSFGNLVSEHWENGTKSEGAGIIESAAILSSPSFDKSVVIVANARGLCDLFAVPGRLEGNKYSFAQIKKLAKGAEEIDVGGTAILKKSAVIAGLKEAGFRKAR